jgi:ribosomal protein S18 acetylase RimI-like enzyme
MWLVRGAPTKQLAARTLLHHHGRAALEGRGTNHEATNHMILNYETVIVGERCVLVPYRAEHVPTYHSWMQDPELLQATASEPLTLQEEYEMQSSWRDDPNKCTYIVLARESCTFRSASSDGTPHNQPSDDVRRGGDNDSTNVPLVVFDDDDDFVERNIHAMAGDVNLFLSQEDEMEDEPDCPGGSGDNADVMNDCDEIHMPPRHQSTAGTTQAEIDIMIADPTFRSKGLGREACALMIRYGARHLHVRRFFCKIQESNSASLQLFKSMGFKQCGYAECFREVELELRCEGGVDSAEKSSLGSRIEIESELSSFTSRVVPVDASVAAGSRPPTTDTIDSSND